MQMLVVCLSPRNYSILIRNERAHHPRAVQMWNTEYEEAGALTHDFASSVLNGPWIILDHIWRLVAWNCPTCAASVYGFLLTWSNYSVPEILSHLVPAVDSFPAAHCMEHCLLVAKILIWIHCLTGQTFWTRSWTCLSSDIAVCPKGKLTSNSCTIRTWQHFKFQESYFAYR